MNDIERSFIEGAARAMYVTAWAGTARRIHAIRSGGTMPDHAELFHEANSLGAKRFGTLWLQATADLVGMLKEAGFGDQLERDYKLRAGVARGLYRVLMTATGHPNNLARALSLAETERMLKKAEEWGAKED